MLENIIPARTTTVIEYRREYEWPNRPGAGYSFPCDRHGNIILTDTLAINVERCETMAARGEILDLGIVEHVHHDVKPAHGKCDCGRTVWLDHDHGYGCGCDCGRNYNLSGQELAPMSQWEERIDADDRWTVAELHHGYDN